jgi:hypothetical protein
LEAAEKEGRKNRQRQKRAMQKEGLSNTNSTTNHPDQGPRQYSTLRARRKTSEAAATVQQQGKQPPPQLAKSVQDLSYWQYYRLVVARVAETLLMWLGEDEEEESEKLRKRKEEED